MKRLSLEELKAQKGNGVVSLEAIKGGNAAGCHCGICDRLKEEALEMAASLAAGFAAFANGVFEGLSN